MYLIAVGNDSSGDRFSGSGVAGGLTGLLGAVASAGGAGRAGSCATSEPETSKAIIRISQRKTGLPELIGSIRICSPPANMRVPCVWHLRQSFIASRINSERCPQFLRIGNSLQKDSNCTRISVLRFKAIRKPLRNPSSRFSVFGAAARVSDSDVTPDE